MKNSMLKKVCAVALVGIMTMGLAGCGTKKDEAKKDMLDVIKENGKVVVGLSADYKPYEFHAIIDGKDTVVGFDIELAEEIAKDLGVELEISEMEFDSLITALPSGKIDLIISGMNPDETRKKAVDFSEIYYVSQHGILVRAEDKDKYKSIEDLNGKAVGAQLGSTQEKLAKEKIQNPDMHLLSNLNDLVLELKAGKIEALITEVPVAEMAIKSNPGLALSEQKFNDESGGNAVGIKKGSPKLTEQINKTIQRLIDDGSMSKFIDNAIKLTDKEVKN